MSLGQENISAMDKKRLALKGWQPIDSMTVAMIVPNGLIINTQGLEENVGYAEAMVFVPCALIDAIDWILEHKE